MSAHNLLLSLNQLTARDLSLAAAARAARETGFQGIGVLPSTVAELGVRGVRSVLDGEGLQPTSVCAFIGLIGPTPAACAERMTAALRCLEHAAALDVPLVVVTGGPSAGLTPQGAWEKAAAAVDALLERAALMEAAILVEPLHPVLVDQSVATSIPDALALIGKRDGAGIVIDTWHVWWDCHLREWLGDAAGRAGIVHLSDWAGAPAGSLDRALPGDGMACLPDICADLLGAGFDGWWEVEVLSEPLWAGDQVALVHASYEAAVAVLGKALSRAGRPGEDLEPVR